MISRQKLEPLVLACAVVISRFAFPSHDLYDLDSVNFTRAMERFDYRVHQPIRLGNLCTSSASAA
jgi:hypothetical protein